MTDHIDDAAQLISRCLDGVITAGEEARLAERMKTDAGVVDLYVRMMQIHGQLIWGAAHAEQPFSISSDLPQDEVWSASRRHWSMRNLRWLIPLVVVALGVATLGIRQLRQPGRDNATDQSDMVLENGIIGAPEIDAEETSQGAGAFTPLQFDSLDPVVADHRDDDQSAFGSTDAGSAGPGFVVGADVSDEEVIAAIDQQISSSLLENGVEASPRAAPEEWKRRVWLTLAGRIPTLQELPSKSFDSGVDFRPELVDRLLQGTQRSHRLAEVWTTLLVGRAERSEINRDALQDYLFLAFEENRPWIRIVGELVSAEGRADENGAANFLLAHLDNQATPATAVTARLFLGEQLQCVQCHDHPFAAPTTQQDYWAFNAFFQNSAGTSRKSASSAARMDAGVSILTDQPVAGMTFFETLSGRQEAVVPAYDGHSIPADSAVARRAVLARLLASDSESRVARSMVNRVWADFFGYGFTNPVDDMGPHATVSHPELLETLTSAFTASGYDLRRLQRWIALSAAWARTSQTVPGNEVDAPESGTVPLFSRVYLRRMAPEQVYDSIRVAVRAVAGQAVVTKIDSEHRRQWVSQFVRPYDTDENDEADEFNGNIAQAMVMMNGADIAEAIQQAGDTFLERSGKVQAADGVLERVSLAVLSRIPTERESAVFRRYLGQLRRTIGYRNALPQVAEDMLWAYLNSSEFLLIH